MPRSNQNSVFFTLSMILSYIGILLGIMYVADIAELSFYEVATRACVLFYGPLFIGVVFLIEHLSIPLPIRFGNTWPIIAATFWVGIHRMLQISDESFAMRDILGERILLPASASDLHWYSQEWFFITVIAAIIIGGYLSILRAAR